MNAAGAAPMDEGEKKSALPMLPPLLGAMEAMEPVPGEPEELEGVMGASAAPLAAAMVMGGCCTRHTIDTRERDVRV